MLIGCFLSSRAKSLKKRSSKIMSGASDPTNGGFWLKNYLSICRDGPAGTTFSSGVGHQTCVWALDSAARREELG